MVAKRIQFQMKENALNRSCVLLLGASLALLWWKFPAHIAEASIRTDQQSGNPRAEQLAGDYADALSLVLERSCQATDPSDLRVRFTVCGRILPPFENDPELGFSIRQYFDGTVRAVIVRPKSTSIRSQLHKLLEQQTTASAEDLAKMVLINLDTTDQQRSPALKDLAVSYGEIRFSPALPDELTMDSTKYELRYTAAYGNSLKLVLYGPGSDAARQTHPLLRWIESLKRALTQRPVTAGGAGL